MGTDAILKRFFPLVVCLLLGIAAYFQASGLGQLVVSSVAGDSSAQPMAAAPQRKGFLPPPANTDHTSSGAAILSRNPFDSATGPLDGKPVPTDEPAAEPPPTPDSGGPSLEDPGCDGKVTMIMASEDPSWSFASIQGSDGKSVLRRIGDEVNGQKVLFISWERVWLVNAAGQRCQLWMWGPVQKRAGGGGVTAPAPEPTFPSTRSSSRRKVPPEIASKIHKISDTSFEVERSVVDQVLENQAELMRSVRVVPEKDGEKVTGLRLFGIRPDSLLGSLGLENGDRLQSINNFDINDPQKALEAYTRLRQADHLTVTINRRGKPTNIDFAIK